ncbi:ImmA/IrrE family metallo-endopeptidase [Bacillus spizizenii]|uniref:ImmA/IrrE family metallo-endopeptidase n=1 Tax=Bacillus spizizenii TaxID=96241 RepID=A0A9Q4DQN6_BACSC|nr:ImmA/IrrE family metallo-endopeptidase [Bacillus spizizenii]MEC0628070.1 ImmA/IrrE family metallo-endopeptidase [Bacillus spizizenii]
MTLYHREIKEAISTAYAVYKQYKNIIKNPLTFRADGFVMQILYSEGIYVDSHAFSSDLCGLFHVDEYEKTIVFNSNQPVERRNFTLGHELGHYFIHSEMQSQFTDRTKDLVDNSIKPFEIQANVFASYTLLPKDVLEEMLNAKYSFHRIKKVVKISKEALFWRLVNHLIEVYDFSSREANLITNDYLYYSIKKLNNEAHHLNAQIFRLTLSNKESIVEYLRNSDISNLTGIYNQGNKKPKNNSPKLVIDIIKDSLFN